MVTGIEQPSDNDLYLHACCWTMCKHDDLNDSCYSLDCSHVRCGDCGLSRREFKCFADFLIEWNHRNVVTGVEQPSDNDLHFHAYCWTMRHHNDVNDNGESHDCSHVCCGDCGLSRWEFKCFADFFIEWNHRNVVSGFEQPSDNDLHLHAYCWTMRHNNDVDDYG